jgi:hypothetical protein
VTTTSRRAPRPTSTLGDGLSREDYATFIGQIELFSVWLHNAAIINHAGPREPEPKENASVHIESDAKWEAVGDGFNAFHRYEVKISTDDEPSAEIAVEFGLHFHSHQAMTDVIFETFSDNNLPVNSWPYLREFLASSTGRMGWLPYTLPALKRGVPKQPAPKPSLPSATKTRARKAKES